MKSIMTHAFSQVPTNDTPRSSFDRSFGHKTTFDAGWLIPVYADEVLPGDTFKLNMSAFARLATPIKPVMDNLFLESFFFFIPNRLVWSNWEHFMGAKDNPSDSTTYQVPYIVTPNVAGGGVPVGHLFDYLGIPVGGQSGGGATTGLTLRTLLHRCYNLCWNSWFRDENLQNSVTVDLGDGPDTWANYTLLRRNKRHDYFTSCLPWPQKGTAVTIPLGTSAPVVRGANAPWWQFYDDGTNTIHATAEAIQSTNAGVMKGAGGTQLSLDPRGGLTADLTNASSATINALRQAFQLQKMYEKDARGGTRYIEILRSHFRVVSPDHRLQRPEYLGGGSSVINIHPVAMTAASSGGASGGQQGNLAAFGTASFNGHGFTKSFVEHGMILGLVNVRADLTYQQGMSKMFSRVTRDDHYWPSYAFLGEQTVLNREIYTNLQDGTGAAQKDGVFGYQERHAEYRYKPSQISGLFRTASASGLDSWHLSQSFASQPTLGTTFIAEDPPIDRVIAVPSEPHIIFDSFFVF